MEIDNNPANDIATEEDCEEEFDVWSDEGARIFNEMIEEGATYMAANPQSLLKYDEDFDADDCDYRDPDLYDMDEWAPSPARDRNDVRKPL